MSRGLGWLQRECLRVIDDYRLAGKEPTTFNIAAEVYQVKRDRHGNRMITDAQHVATKRALGSLRRSGLITGKQKTTMLPDGTKILEVVGQDGIHAERCNFWARLGS